MMQTSEQINEIAAACAKAQAELENVAKDGNNPHFHARYATLAAVLEEVRPKYAKHGVVIWQFPINGEGSNIGVVTRFAHSSGQWIESTLFVAPMKFDAQGAGSVTSYLRRYSLMSIAGIAADDDDGNAAVARPEQRARANGHTAAPLPPPLPPPPPHDPQTGEIVPHAITVPTRPNTDLPDWLTYGSRVIAALKSAGDISELARWHGLNAPSLDKMADGAPKAHKSVLLALETMQAKLTAPPDMLGADETERVLSS